MVNKVQYLNKDFQQFKNALVNYTKAYFPNTYNDFSDESTGMLFMEQASYVGDVLSNYLDTQIQETFLPEAKSTKSIFDLAYVLGYRPKVTTPATTKVDIYQIVPAKQSGSNYFPDFDYSLRIPINTVVSANGDANKTYLTRDEVVFSESSSINPTDVSVYQISGNTPIYYLLKKSVDVISANIVTRQYNFSAPEPFQTITIDSNNIISILDVIDSDGNEWYEVPNLSQDNVYYSIKNTNTNDPNRGTSSEVSKILRLKSVNRRFTSKFLDRSTLEVQFGSGVTVQNNDEEVVPNIDNVGSGLGFGQSKLTTAYSPNNFIFTDAYGVSPYNTTLTFRYLVGGGVQSNTPSNTITGINTTNVKFANAILPNNALADTIFQSIAVNNVEPATGGKDGDTNDEIKINALGNYQNQLRTVTTDDYLIRALSMPSQYGAISKGFANSETISELAPGELPSTVNLYILGFNQNKKLDFCSTELKQNLKTYLSQYRIINDNIKIKDAYIINIGIDFEIIVLPDYTNNEVLLSCINVLKDYFNIDKWQINQPIMLKELEILLDKVAGVQTVKKVNIVNKDNNIDGYSNYSYDIKGATLNGIIYPSIDPMIFEVRYPDIDIKGKVSPL